MSERLPGIVVMADYPLTPSRIGGMDRFFWSMEEAMRRRGWAPEWIVPAEGEHDHYLERGFDLVRLPRARFLEAALEHLRGRGGADLLVTHFVPYATRYALEWLPRGMVHGMRLRLKGAVLFPFVDRVIAVSGFVRDAILHELGGHWEPRTVVVRNGVDPAVPGAEHDRVAAGEEVRIVTIAHLISDKGIQVLLEALRLAAPSLPAWSLAVAGSGPHEAALREIASASGFGGRVRFLGSVSQPERLLREADVSVVPSLWKEACPFVVLESLAAGVGLIASRIGGTPELVGGEAGVLFEPGNAADLADRLVAVCQDRAFRRRLASAAVERARCFTGATMVAGHITEMERLLPERAA
jgi:glycosyltransferase involved in cell wall biosynthesis